MKKSTKTLGAILTSGVFAVANPSWALAASNFESCTSTASNSYSCIAASGYRGLDPYNVNRFSNRASDGSLHSCTSYAAYRLYYSNSYMPLISTLDSAQYWATEAVSRLGATIQSVPKVGDIAWWDSAGVPSLGHVAVVDSITYTTTGLVYSVKVSDDNSGRLVSTTKVLYPGVSSGAMIYPQKFIRFPGYGSGTGGGGRPPIAMNQPFSTTDSLEVQNVPVAP